MDSCKSVVGVCCAQLIARIAFLSRTVTYTADPKEGFKAEVVREPTDIVIKVPTQAPQTQEQQYRQAGPAPKQAQQQQYIQPSQQQQYRPQQQQARPDYSQYQQQ